MQELLNVVFVQSVEIMPEFIDMIQKQFVKNVKIINPVYVAEKQSTRQEKSPNTVRFVIAVSLTSEN